MDHDTDKIDEAVLGLLYLTLHDSGDWGARAWKSHDWETMNRLHDKGLIGDPKSKSKSVVLSPDGVEKCREAFERLFGKSSTSSD